jgi:hypothetical protein
VLDVARLQQIVERGQFLGDQGVDLETAYRRWPFF